MSIGMLAGAWPDTALAGSADKTSSVTLGPDTFKVPTAPDYKLRGVDAARTDPSSTTALPDRVDLGGSVLRFDTSRNVLTPAPTGALDETDQAVLNPRIPTRKDSPLQPNYFGLTLTTPTR